MTITLLFTIISGVIAGSVLLGSKRNQKPGERSSRYTLMIAILAAGLLFLLILLPFAKTKNFFYVVGLVPVFFGMYYLGLIRIQGSSSFFSDTMPPLLIHVFKLSGNVFLLAVFYDFYNWKMLQALLFFIVFGLVTILTGQVLRVLIIGKYHKNVTDFLEFSEMLNGMFLVITGLIVFTGQIMVLEYILQRIIK
jgi:hypothetical protein